MESWRLTSLLILGTAKIILAIVALAAVVFIVRIP